MIDSRLLKCAGLSMAALALLPGLRCIMGPGPSETCDPEIQFAETEPNGEVATAEVIQLEGAECILVTGRIDDAEDSDLFEIGPASAGDRITVDVNTAQTDLDARVVVFDLDTDGVTGDLVATQDDPADGTGSLDPLMDVVLRHDGGRYVVGISASFGSLLTAGDYEMLIRVQRGGTAPSPAAQTILLDYDGGNTTTRSGQTITIAPFAPTVIDASYAGATQMIKKLVTATVREDFAEYHVEVLSTDEQAPPTGGAFSTLFIGQVTSAGAILGSEVLGVALDGTDAYNADPADDAIVLVANFGPATFGLLEPLTAAELGVAIGSVASHEAGHLLGLHHVYDPGAIMNTLTTPTAVLVDQQFKRALVGFTIFDSLETVLTQNARRLLGETVGRIQRVAHATYPVGDTPLTLASADLDGDGDHDLVVANRLADSLSILLNDGSGNLAPAGGLDLGAGPVEVIAFDADGDGDSDLAVGTAGGSLVLLLVNDGSAGFAERRELTAGDGPNALAAAQLDGDDGPDLAVGNFLSIDVSVFMNDDGAFAAAGTYPVGESDTEAPVSAAAADLNGDGAVDLVTANFQGDYVAVLLNNGDGTFAEAVETTAGWVASSVAAADLDGDGDADLAVANLFSTLFLAQFISDVTILLNNGDGTFAAPASYFVSESADGVSAADLDDDGDVDLAVACTGDFQTPQDRGELSLLLNRGDGTFAQSVPYQAGYEPRRVVATDLNGDGQPDLAVVNQGSNDVSVFFNNGDGTFGITVDVPIP